VSQLSVDDRAGLRERLPGKGRIAATSRHGPRDGDDGRGLRIHAARTASRLVLLTVALVALSPLAGCGDDGASDALRSSAPATPSPSASSSPSASASPSSAGVTRLDVEGSLVVAREEGRRWALWRVTPSTGIEERIAELPFEPTHAYASPDGSRVAYLRVPWVERRRGRLAILDVTTGRVGLVSHAGSGLWSTDCVTWLSSSTLLVSGPTEKGDFFPWINDRLRVLDVRTGAFSPFKVEAGTEPSAALKAGAVVYDRLTKVQEKEGDDLVREDLILFDIDGDAESVLLSEEYIAHTAGRCFQRPTASPDARYLLTAATGSDTGVGWLLRRVGDDEPLWAKETSMAYPLHAGWDGPGRRVAFWGAPVRGPGRTIVWVYDVRKGTFAKSTTLGKSGYVTGLDWSKGGDLAVGTSGAASRPSIATVSVAPGGEPSGFVEIGEGLLPVWVD
jgi:hypothetical protein